MTPNLPVHLQRRTLSEQLRYLAGKLTDGAVLPIGVALSLQVIADEQEAASLGFVVARIDRHGQATLTGASVYELREDADWHAAKCRDRAPAGLEIKVCQVVPADG